MEDVRRTLAEHFRAPARQALIQGLSDLPNSFEGWFTAEALFALRSRWPHAKLSSNSNYSAFKKPDIVFEGDGFIGVYALKHISTLHPDAQSRWDGKKDSTVAKDIKNLRCVQVGECCRRVLVFYGPGHPILHDRGAACQEHRLLCIACSVQHLSDVVVAGGGEPVSDPVIETVVDNGRFHLLDFAV